jgi:hypothetical protein
LRIEGHVGRPVETAALVADPDLHAIGLDGELEFDETAAIVAGTQASLDLQAPHAAANQVVLLLVADAEIAVLEPVDQQLGDAGNHAIGLGAQVCYLRGDQVALVQVAHAKPSERHQVEDAPPLAQRFVQRLFVNAVIDRAAHHGLQHFAVIGPGEVVIGAGAQSLDHFLAGISRGLHQHRNALGRFVFLDVPEHLHAIDAGHRAVEDDDVVTRWIRFQQTHGLLAVGRGDQVEAVAFQVCADGIDIDRLVVDDQYRGLRTLHWRSCSPEFRRSRRCPCKPLSFTRRVL